jgi:hypothetical protein
MTAVYIVWSNKQNAWWGPGGRYYTQDVWDAQRYSLEDAEKACGIRTWEPGKVPPEVAIKAPESGRAPLAPDEVEVADALARRLAAEVTRKVMADRQREGCAL